MAVTTKPLNLKASPSIPFSCSSLPSPIISFNSQLSTYHFRLKTNNSFHSFYNPSILHLQRRFLLPPIRAASSSDSVNDEEDKYSGGLMKWAQPLVEFVGSNFLPLALISGVVLGLANPSLGCFADKYYLSKVSTFCNIRFDIT